MIRHEIKWSMLLSLRVQICLLTGFSILSLEVVFCKSDVRFSSSIFLTRVGSLVDNWWLEAVPVERACDLVGRCKFCFLLYYLWFYLRRHRWARINLKFGYRYILPCEPSTTNKWKIKQRNNTLWYNPAFSKKVSTNIGHRFLVLVEKHLPEEIFNRNVIKISDNCMNSTKQIIDNHNKPLKRELITNQACRDESVVSLFFPISK